MGCFAFTCCVSGLPIEDMDPVRYLLLTKCPFNPEPKWSCSIHELWFLRTFPIKANYNHYGSITNIESNLLKDIMFNSFSNDIILKDVGKNYIHDVAVHNNMTIDEYLEALWEGRISVKGYEGKELPIAQAMIREDVWNSLLKIRLPDCVINKYEDYLNIIIKNIEQSKNINKQFLNRIDGLFCTYHNVELVNRDSNFICTICENEKLTIPNSNIPRLKTFSGSFDLESAFQIIVEKEAEKSIVEVVAQTIYIQILLDTLRYQWRPASANGPQFGEFKTHMEYFKAMSKIAKNMIRNEY